MSVSLENIHNEAKKSTNLNDLMAVNSLALVLHSADTVLKQNLQPMQKKLWVLRRRSEMLSMYVSLYPHVAILQKLDGETFESLEIGEAEQLLAFIGEIVTRALQQRTDGMLQTIIEQQKQLLGKLQEGEDEHGE